MSKTGRENFRELQHRMRFNKRVLAALERISTRSALYRTEKPKPPVQCEPMHPDAEGWSEWIHPIPGYLMQCCDCGLIHEMQFQIVPADGNDLSKLNEGETAEGLIIFRAKRFEGEE